MIFAGWAFASAKTVRNEMRIDSSGVLEGSRYRRMLQEPIFDSMNLLEEIVLSEQIIMTYMRLNSV